MPYHNKGGVDTHYLPYRNANAIWRERNPAQNTHHQGALVQLVNQELWRIQYVQQRDRAIKDGRLKAIANFDGKRGMQFRFLPELNTYVFENGESFLDRMIRFEFSDCN